MAGRKPARPTQAQQLNDALSFVSVGTGDFQDWQEYVRLSGKMAVTYNGQIGAGYPIQEELNYCPQLSRMSAALKRCGKTLVISETSNEQISIKGDKLTAKVPTMPPANLPPIAPDPNIHAVSDVLKTAFKVCGVLASEAGETIYEASLLLEANTCTSVGKSKALCLQYWHGIDLPPAIIIPKAFAEAVAKVTSALVGFGFSWRCAGPTNTPGECGDYPATITFWFDGGSWIKTQCYDDRWGDINGILNVPSYPVELQSGLIDAVEAIINFNDDATVYFADGKLMSHNTDLTGAQYQVNGLQGGKVFNGKFLKQIAPHVKTFDFTTYPDKAFFFGGSEVNPVRGAIMTMGYKEPQVKPDAPGAFDQVQETGSHISGDPVDDIEDDEINKGWGQD